MHVVELEKEHVGRGIDGAQRAIDLERLGGRLEIEPLRQHHLEYIAGGNIFLRPPDATHEIIVRRAVVDFNGLGFAAVRPVQMLSANSSCQFPLDGGDVGERTVIGLARRLRANVGRGNDVELVAQMIEGQQPVVKGEDAIGEANIIFRALGQALELPDHVVGEISHAAGGKRRKAG